MFISNESKIFSSCILFHQDSIQSQFGNILRDAFDGASGEVQFLKNLADKFDGGNAISLPSHTQLEVKTWAKLIHQRPYVETNGVRGPELGDLLVSVRYELSGNVVDEKSIIYQVKVEKTQNSGLWTIAHNQLHLLTEWPEFNLMGSKLAHNTSPLTKEASSYLLLRKPQPAKPDAISIHPSSPWVQMLGGANQNYGLTASAIDLTAVVDSVQDDGVSAYKPTRSTKDHSTVSQKSIENHSTFDWWAFTEHMAFQRGESHEQNPNFKTLIEEVFSFVGSQPAGTDFSHGYFCAIKIVVKKKQ